VGKEVRATTTVHMLSMLGHLEIDWETDVWAIAPPTLTVLPNAGAHAILSGCRNRQLLSAFEAATQSEDYFSDSHAQDWGPDAVFVAANDERSVEALAQQLGVAYEVCVSERLTTLLPPLDSYLACCKSTPGARGYGVERFDLRSLTFQRAESDSAAGFYRYDLWGRPEFRFVSNERSFYRLDKALGVHAEIARSKTGVIRFEPDSVNGVLTVPFGAQLPALHARTAVLCSGLMPHLNNAMWRYQNVPRATAAAIAQALNQPLIIGGSEGRT
jgi:hypothetical protein